MIPYSPEAYQLFHEGTIALAQLETNGMRVDTKYLDRAMKKTLKRVARLEAKLADSEVMKLWRKTFRTKMNTQSTDQLGKILFDIMGYDCPHLTKTGKYSTSEDTLATIDDPFVNDYLKIKKLQKAHGTFLSGIKREVVDGYIHPSFNLQFPKTFRSSSDSPNFQNLPVRQPEIKELVRRAIRAREHHRLVEIDYGGVEVCVAACYHLDPSMINYIKDPDTDMHRDMAMKCFMLPQKEVTDIIRYCGKNMFVFPQFYGAYWLDCAAEMWKNLTVLNLVTTSGKNLKKHLAEKGIKELGDQNRKGSPRLGTFEAHIQKIEKWFWEKRFPVYAKWKKAWYEAYKRKGWFLTKTGFICQGHMKKNEVINYGVQGSAFHILLLALILIQKEINKRGMKTKLTCQIHDSLIADVPENELEDYLKLAKKIMIKKIPKRYSWIIVPLTIDAEITPVGGSWVDKQKIEI